MYVQEVSMHVTPLLYTLLDVYLLQKLAIVVVH